MSCTVFSKLLGQTTELKYRGVILVLLDIATPNVLPKGVDFIYVDDKEILFNRVSNQNSFLENPSDNSAIMCCEITYAPGDSYDNMDEDLLIEKVKQQFSALNLCSYEQIRYSKIIKLPEVYPMYFGYRKALNKTKEEFDKIRIFYSW